MKTSRKAAFSGTWRTVLGVMVSFCRMVLVLATVFLFLPVGMGKVIVACVAAGWLPPEAVVVAYLLPVPVFGLAMLLPLVFSLRDRARWARVLFRVFVGEAEERFEQLANRFPRNGRC